MSESDGEAEPGTRLGRLRNSPSRRRRATNAAVVAGVILAAVHPVGLLLGGALTALPQRRFVTGVLAALAFGGVALAAFAARLALAGALGPALATGQILGVTVAAAFLLPLLGSLARGVV